MTRQEALAMALQQASSGERELVYSVLEDLRDDRERYRALLKRTIETLEVSPALAREIRAALGMGSERPPGKLSAPVSARYRGPNTLIHPSTPPPDPPPDPPLPNPQLDLRFKLSAPWWGPPDHEDD